MRALLASADAGELTYTGEGDADAAAGTMDSRRLLDLLENAGAPGMQDLFVRTIFSPEVAGGLGARADARAQYAQLVAAGGGWAAPAPVRLAMTRWEFDTAKAHMADATTLLETRDELAAHAEPLELEVPGALEHEYETAAELGPVEDHAEALVDATAAIADAEDAVDGSHGLLASIGLIGSGADDAVDDARAAFEQGDAAAATNAAERAEATIDDANSAGALRIAIAAGVVLVLAAGVILLVRRSRRRAPATEEQPPWIPPPPSTSSAG
jgi:hypothetical protein